MKEKESYCLYFMVDKPKLLPNINMIDTPNLPTINNEGESHLHSIFYINETYALY